MKAVIQRVARASVSVGGRQVSEIGRGLMILLGVVKGDTQEEAEKLARKIAGMRIFPDAEGVMNVNCIDAGASLRRGNRPSYVEAAGRPEALPLYDSFCQTLGRLTGKEVARGEFGADMQVELINDGPVTIIADTKDF